MIEHATSKPGRQVPRFLQVGAIGFLIDAGVLGVLVYGLGLPPVPARGVSFAATIVVTFVLNARYTFSASIRASNKGRYVAIQLVGAGINFVSYTLLVGLGPMRDWPIAALVVGSALSSAHNFYMMRRFVFVATVEPATKGD